MSAPTLPAGHEEYEALAVAWALAALEPADQDRFEEHRAEGCPTCAETVGATLDVAAELALAIPAGEPPPDLRRRVLAATAEHPRPRLQPPPVRPRQADDGRFPGLGSRDGHGAAGPDHRPGPDDAGELGGPSGPAAWADGHGVARPDRRPGPDGVSGLRGPAGPAGPHGSADPGRSANAGGPGSHPATRDAARSGPGRHRAHRRRRLTAVLAAAALALVSGAAAWQVATRDAPSGPAATASADRVAALSARVGDRTVATVVLRNGNADVVTDVLPATTGRGTNYVLWGVPADGAGSPTALGTFEVTGDGLHAYRVRLVRPAGDYPVLAVSEEPAGRLPAAPTAVLARGALSR